MEIYQIIIALVGSAFAGMINTLAGNGSAITLTILMEVLGLPPNLANGTNRIGVCTQSLASTYGFYRNGKLNVSRSGVYLFFITLGALIGVIVSVNISNEAFREVFKYLLVLMLVVILINPKRWLRETDTEFKLSKWWSIPLSLAVGFYGGFIQMGMGIFFLIIMVLIARYSLTDANAIKVAVVAVYTALAIGIFHYQGLIDWKIGSLMAVGQATGGFLTANYAAQSPKANLWAHRILIVVVIAAILRLFLTNPG